MSDDTQELELQQPGGADAPAEQTPAPSPADEQDSGVPAKSAQPRDDQGRFIPKGRFDEAVGKERDAREAAERRLAELEAQMAQVNRSADTSQLENAIRGMEAQHAKALMDGDHERAAHLMTQIRLNERTIALAEAQNMSAQARAQASEEVRVEMAISTLEKTYEVLNTNSASYDQDVVDMVLATQQHLISSAKMSPSQALVKAAEKVMTKLMPTSREAAPKAGLAAGTTAKERTAAQVAKNIDTATRQPGSMKDLGLDSDSAGKTTKLPDVSQMSDDEFRSLPASTRARMRGDFG